MNILEDYISWGWDVTKGEQFWEPTVSKIFENFEMFNFFIFFRPKTMFRSTFFITIGKLNSEDFSKFFLY